MEAEVQCTADISHDALHSSEMRLSGIMHMKEHLLNRVSDVRLSESEVLEGACKTAELSGVLNRGTIDDTKFWVGVHRCRAWIAVQHIGALKYVTSVLLLGKVQSCGWR